jgi:colanic acid biosynthesis glycosyl transferase WcaI
MKILVLSINYSPEPTGFAPHITALCEHMALKGHSVTVMTGFPFAPYWHRLPSNKGKFFLKEFINNVKVLRLTHFIPRRPDSFVQRILLESSFCITAAFVNVGQRTGSWDLLVYVGAQPSIAMLTRVIAHVKKCPYVVKITDLASQAAEEVGIIKSKLLKRILIYFEYSAYLHAQGIIVLCNGFKESLIAHKYPDERIAIIRDSVNLDLIYPKESGDIFRQQYRLSRNDFVVLFSGSMGKKQGLVNVIEAARLLKEKAPHVKWVLVGDGELKPTIDSLVDQYKIEDEVRLLPLQPENAMADMFSAANLLLLNQLRTLKDTVIPSKLLTYMAAGKPVLAAVNIDSQGAILLKEAKGGIIVEPENPAELANAVYGCVQDSSDLREMGQRNRVFSEKHFDRRQIVAEQEIFIEEIVRHYKAELKHS